MFKITEETKKWITLIIIGAIAYLIADNLALIIEFIKTIFIGLKPFILGGAIAFILNIPMSKIEKLLKKKIKNKNLLVRIISIILSLLLFIGIISFVAFLLIPELVENIESLIVNIPSLITTSQNFIIDLLDRFPDVQSQIVDVFNKTSNISDIASNVLNYITNGALSFVSNIVTSVITIFTGIVFSIYMLSQKEYLIKGSKKVLYAILKQSYVDKLLETLSLSNKIFSKFISGQCLEAGILGLLIFIALSIFKFPYTIIISVLTAITALVPIFGALIAMLVGIILIGITNPIKAILFVVVFQVVQQIEGNFIYPKVVGKSVGLSPLFTLLAITVGGNLFGITGMLIGLPIASIAYAVIKDFVNDKLKEKKIKIEK